MDFARDGKISEEEFMRATGHYRRLGKLLTINTWQNIRKGRLHTFVFFQSLLLCIVLILTKHCSRVLTID